MDDNSGVGGSGLIAATGQSAQVGADTKIAFTRGSLKYDSPFLDMSSTFIPRGGPGTLPPFHPYSAGASL